MTYADNYNLRLATATANDVASAVDGLLISYQRQILSSTISSTSAASTVMTGSSVTISVASGEVVEINACVTLSHSVIGSQIEVTVEEDGVNITPNSRWIATASLTNGIEGTVSYHNIITTSVGSHTYKLKWATSAATAYSNRSILTVKALQNT